MQAEPRIPRDAFGAPSLDAVRTPRRALRCSNALAALLTAATVTLLTSAAAAQDGDAAPIKLAQPVEADKPAEPGTPESVKLQEPAPTPAQPTPPEGDPTDGDSTADGDTTPTPPEGDPDSPEGEIGDEETGLAGDVIITANRHERAVFETSVGTNIVDSKQLAREAPRTPAEALRDQPGIWVQKTGHIGGAPIIRGLMGNQILLMVDGVRLNNVGLFAGPNSFLQTIDIENVERIEVVRGPGSVLYGTDALGGVINVITRAPLPWAEEGEGWRNGSRLKATFGGVDFQRRLRADVYGGNSELRLRLGGTVQEVGDLRGGGDIGVQHPGGWSELNGDAQVDYRPSRNHILSLAFNSVNQSDITRFDNYLGGSAGPSDRRRQLSRLNYHGRNFADGLTGIEAGVYYHDQGSNSERFVGDQTSEDTITTFGADLQLQSPLTSWLFLTYGLHAHHDDAHTENESGGVITSDNPDATWDNVAAFVQGEFDLGRWVTLTAAGRLDYYRFKTDPNVPLALEGLNPEDLRLDVSQLAPTGSFGVVGRLNEFVNLVANVGTAFRAPNISDTVSSGVFTFGYNVPSPDVGPERSTTFEIGPRVAHEYVSASASYFYTKVDNLIDSTPGTFNGQSFVDVNGNGVRDDGEDVYVKGNVAEAHIQGVEAQVALKLPPNWTLFGGFTWLTGRDDTNDLPLDRATPTNGNLGLRWQDSLAQRFWVEVSGRVVADFDAKDIPEDRLTRDAAFKVNPQDSKSALLSGDGTVPGYWLLNLRGGAVINEHLEAQLAATNLLNVEYRDKDSRIDGEGLNVLGTFVLRY